MKTFNIIPLLIVLIIVLKIINSRLDTEQSKLRNEFAKEKLKYGLASRYSLSQLPNNQFIDFCNEFLIENDYKNIKLISEKLEGGITFTADKGKTLNIYIHCYKAINEENSNTNDNYTHVGRPALQKFVGAMVEDNIYNALVITNGNISGEAKEYVENLPQIYNMELIDGINFSKACWDIRKNNIRKEFLQNS
ncbi:restriction endonuclease [Clostridium ganghwense]|uniref:Restriction endonuclease n=1 Tax=Clostridium ganghwense TaxID=312089 RepID=A0ABT4CWS1_9CLOT|nr:restriction endonuclease [Clostridium ganghwense]MCY6372481.1 restriction endonuclease [Clostridium ganghwense]